MRGMKEPMNKTKTVLFRLENKSSLVVIKAGDYYVMNFSTHDPKCLKLYMYSNYSGSLPNKFTWLNGIRAYI